MRGRGRGRDPSRHLLAAASGSTTCTATSCARRTAAGSSSTPASARATRSARWRPVLDELDAPVEQIVVTHMHPDHVGGARDVAGLTGAPVLQGREDYEQCVRAWGEHDPDLFARLLGLARAAARGRPGDGRATPDACSTPSTGCATRSSSTPGDDVDGWQRRGPARPRRRPHRAAARRRADRRRHDPERDHAGDRPLPEVAARPARRLSRDAGPDRGARAAGRIRRPQGPDPGARPPARARSRRTTTSAWRAPRRRSTAGPLTAYAVSLELFPERPLADAPALRDGRVARAPRAPRARGQRASREGGGYVTGRTAAGTPA